MDAIKLWELLFRIYAVLLALLIVSFAFQRPESGARSITIVTGGLLVALIIVLSVFIRREWEPF